MTDIAIHGEIKIIRAIGSCKTIDQLNSCADWLMRIKRFYVQTYQELLTAQLIKIRKSHATSKEVQEDQGQQERPFQTYQLQHTRELLQ